MIFSSASITIDLGLMNQTLHFSYPKEPMPFFSWNLKIRLMKMRVQQSVTVKCVFKGIFTFIGKNEAESGLLAPLDDIRNLAPRQKPTPRLTKTT
jgi:hypothetical protein